MAITRTVHRHHILVRDREEGRGRRGDPHLVCPCLLHREHEKGQTGRTSHRESSKGTRREERNGRPEQTVRCCLCSKVSRLKRGRANELFTHTVLDVCLVFLYVRKANETHLLHTRMLRFWFLS